MIRKALGEEADKELISVIIPVYNVAIHLERCIESVINQTYKNLEIILVDDGSTDTSGAICDKYKLLDSRVIVIHKSNEGVASARNVGIDIAKGSLLAFVDSDDYLELNMLDELKKNMDEYKSDISMCNYYYINSAAKIKKSYLDYLEDNSFGCEDKNKFINIYNQYSDLTIVAWNKLYKKYIFDNIRYPEGKIFEDAYVICNILEQVKTVSYTLKPLYNYVYRDNSITHKFDIKYSDRFDYYDSRILFFKERGYYDLIEKEMTRKMNVLINYLCKMKINGIKNDEIQNKYYQELLDISKEVKWNNASKSGKMFKVLKRPAISLLVYWMKFKSLVK